MKDYFIILLSSLEIATPIVTQALKKTLEGLNIKYNATLVALIAATLLSVIVSAFIMITNSIEFNAINICYIIGLIILNWVGSTVGYDKIKELLKK